jgi:divalent metal cation (Fe/Co/Zn/Cd) transporter
VGVIVAIAAVAFTGILRLDPLVALLVAANILWTGTRIVRRSVLGLMDTALPPQELAAVKAALDSSRRCRRRNWRPSRPRSTAT